MIHAIHNNHNHPIKTANGLYIPKFATIYVDDEGKVVDPLADKPTYDDSDLKARIEALEDDKKSTPNIDLSKYATKEELSEVEAKIQSPIKLNFDASTNTLYVEE